MIDAATIKKIREVTGAGMLDCKKALEATEGDWDKALAWLKEKGLANADKKADRETNEGYIGSYVHATGKIGALVELQCETDFVARNDEFKALAQEIAMQVAAMDPQDEAELLAMEMSSRLSSTCRRVMWKAVCSAPI